MLEINYLQKNKFSSLMITEGEIYLNDRKEKNETSFANK